MVEAFKQLHDSNKTGEDRVRMLAFALCACLRLVLFNIHTTRGRVCRSRLPFSYCIWAMSKARERESLHFVLSLVSTKL